MGIFAIRKGERRDAWAAFLTLFVLIGSHSILETARDALFLSRIPATRLPWVYLAVAAASFAFIQLQSHVGRALGPRGALRLFIFVASGVTLAFFVVLRALGVAGLYALYVWSGLIATLVLTHFWTLMGDLFTITDAKRIYGFIGAGSVLGAIVGSGIASVLARVVAAESLLLAAATGFAVAGLVPLLFSRQSSGVTPEEAPRLADTVAYVQREPYALRVAGSLFFATVGLTVADFLFKSTVAELVPRAQLGAFLGSVYFVVNVSALVCQLLLVGFVLQRVSLAAALTLLPALIVLGGLGVAASSGMFAVLALRAADGSLRHSLHRTASELLFLPLGEEGRRRVKAFVDVAGQRGGQVVASLAILALTALGVRSRSVGWVLAAFAAVWIVSVLSLRKPYVELFRTRLRAGRTHHLQAFPELDVASLETLLSALESDNDAVVMAALSVLGREKKAHLVPAMILYHPSPQVVVTALGILTAARKTNLVPVLDRVADHESPVVRAAVVAARSVLEPDTQQLLLRLSAEDSPEVRATIVVNLIASGEFTPAERKERIESLLRSGTVATKMAFAEAIERRSAAGFDDVLAVLASAEEVEVRRAAVAAIARVPSEGLLPLVVRALTHDATRTLAEQVLASQGAKAFDALLETFEDPSADARLRFRLPPVLTLCSPERSVPVLLRWLPKEQDGIVRFQVVRTLETLIRHHPSLPVERGLVNAAIADTVSRAYLCLDRRLLLERGVARDPSRKTAGHQLLRDLLHAKEGNATGRLFRLLSVLHPAEDFGQILRGLSAGRERRATSMELIESVLREPLRTAVIGLVDDGDDEIRFARAGRYHRPLRLEYEPLLVRLCTCESDAVRDVARFHARELGIEPDGEVERAA